jgi:hypothetical protein
MSRVIAMETSVYPVSGSHSLSLLILLFCPNHARVIEGRLCARPQRRRSLQGL